MSERRLSESGLPSDESKRKDRWARRLKRAGFFDVPLEGEAFDELALPAEPAAEIKAELKTELAPEVDTAYDAAIDSAVASVLRFGPAGAALDPAEPDDLQGPQTARGMASFHSLLERCRSLRFDDPKKMVDLTLLATMAAAQLNPRRHDPREIADCQCRAWIELGNAYRVADKLDDAGHALDHAAELLGEGTGDEGLEARLRDVRADFESWARGSA